MWNYRAQCVCMFVHILWFLSQAGHPFQQRCAHSAYSHARLQQESPVFLLLLDCVWQLWRQFPLALGFSEALLLRLATEAYASDYGTFLGNNDQERSVVLLGKTFCVILTFILTCMVLTHSVFLLISGVLWEWKRRLTVCSRPCWGLRRGSITLTPCMSALSWQSGLQSTLSPCSSGEVSFDWHQCLLYAYVLLILKCLVADSSLCLILRLFSEVDPAGSSSGGGSGGNKKHGHWVGEDGTQLTTLPICMIM